MHLHKTYTSPSPESWWQDFKHHLKRNFISGLVVVVPLVVTGAVIKFLFDAVASLLLPTLTRLYGEVPQYVLAPISVLFIVLGLLLVGSFASHVAVRRVLGWGEFILNYVPFAKTVYSSSKKVVDLLLLHEATPFKDVVLLDYPYPGIKMVGFVSGRVRGVDGGDYYRVFLPTAPNPASGFLHMIRVEDAVLLDMTVEDAIKYIVSAGMLAPAQFKARPAAPDDY